MDTTASGTHGVQGANSGKGPPRLSLVVPCYHEEEVLPCTIPALRALLEGCIADGLASADSEIIFVDDGSSDGTWDRIRAAHRESPLVKGIKLSANRGHQNALLAGLEASRGDFTVSLDADLQDDISVIREMTAYAQNGADIVYGVRKSRTTDTFFKRFTAESFYRVMRLLGVKMVFNHADFRGMSRRAVEALLRYPEKDLFLRALVCRLGFNTATIYYDRRERQAGTTKYPLRKMLSFALHGVTSFSFVPLRVVSVLGCTLFLASLILTLWICHTKYIAGAAVPGWASLLAIQAIFGGIQLLCIGIIGEYLAVIFTEVKNRPNYHIAETTDEPHPASKAFPEQSNG